MEENSESIRHAKILKYLEQNYYMSVAELSEKLNVSLVTIRKDLNILEKNRKLHRVHGGASTRTSVIGERSLDKKFLLNVEEKKSIAAAALRLIDRNDIITIGSGTTTQYLANEIASNNSTFQKLRILSASISSSMILSQYQNFELIQMGGYVRSSSCSVMGFSAEFIAEEHSCNKLFLGADGFDFSFGFSTSSYMEAKLNISMMKNAEKVILLVDSTKTNKRGFSKIADLDALDILITDSNISYEDIVRLEDLGIEVIVANM